MELDFIPLSQELVQLQREVLEHPMLLARLAELESLNAGQVSFELKLGEIAAYCELALDSTYNTNELCDKLYWILRRNRTPIVLSS